MIGASLYGLCIDDHTVLSSSDLRVESQPSFDESGARSCDLDLVEDYLREKWPLRLHRRGTHIGMCMPPPFV